MFFVKSRTLSLQLAKQGQVLDLRTDTIMVDEMLRENTGSNKFGDKGY